MRAIVVTEAGGPDALVLAEVPDPVPGPGVIITGVEYAGVNFIDTYKRAGLYPVTLPFTPGEEGSGVVTAVGDDVTGVSVGDRIAWTGSTGSYAELAAIPASRAVSVPDELDLDVAAAVMLQGMTAHYLVNDTFPLRPGHRCLIHAGAGGVGRLLIQMAKRAGAEVFATAGGAGKVDMARSLADHVVDYSAEDFVAAIEHIAGPRPLDVVYDGVGAATFDGGVALLRPRGTMVLFGGASGPVEPVDPLRLMREGSLYFTRPTLADYAGDRDELLRRAGAVLGAVTAGDLDVLIDRRDPLADAADAHRALEGRETTGKLLLTTAG